MGKNYDELSNMHVFSPYFKNLTQQVFNSMETMFLLSVFLLISFFKSPRSLAWQRCVPIQLILHPRLRGHSLCVFSLPLQTPPPPPATVAFPKASPPVWQPPASSLLTAPHPWIVPKLCFCNATGKHNSDAFQERLLAIEGYHSSGETSQRCQRARGHGGV